MEKNKLIKFVIISLILLICIAYYSYSRKDSAYTDKKDGESNNNAMVENINNDIDEVSIKNDAVEKSKEYTEEISENNTDPEEFISPHRITYKEGFYYEPLSDEIRQLITGVSYKENPDITYDDLRYVGVLYVDFTGTTQTGELICNQTIAQDVVEIFEALYAADYPIEKIRLIDEYGGDDDLSCADNNTSCFNYRVVGGTDTLSKHALGLAIDINPFYNPYITYPNGVERISPEGSEPYADRDSGLLYMILKDDLCYRLFVEHGFTWGGEWKTLKDYQHFQKAP